MVPLAAILLDYPVAYVPTSCDQTAFLSGETLDVYECRLVHPGHSTVDGHTLLKFSCPNATGVEYSYLSPQRLVDRMKERFVTKLQAIDSRITLDINTSTEKFDRVAL